jgi:general stress protein YciG
MSNQNQSSNPGNFKNDPAKASEAGRKGGEHSHGSHEKAGAQANRPRESLSETNRSTPERE